MPREDLHLQLPTRVWVMEARAMQGIVLLPSTLVMDVLQWSCIITMGPSDSCTSMAGKAVLPRPNVLSTPARLQHTDRAVGVP